MLSLLLNSGGPGQTACLQSYCPDGVEMFSIVCGCRLRSTQSTTRLHEIFKTCRMTAHLPVSQHFNPQWNSQLFTSLGIVFHNYCLHKVDEQFLTNLLVDPHRWWHRSTGQGLQPEGLLPFVKTINVFKILPKLVSLSIHITMYDRRDQCLFDKFSLIASGSN